MHGATISFNGIEISGKHDVELLIDDTPKLWDIKPPLGWNWTEDDWRIYNFFRDLDSHGGVLSGGLCDRHVLLRYNKKHPAESLIIFEDSPHAKHDHLFSVVGDDKLGYYGRCSCGHSERA